MNYQKILRELWDTHQVVELRKGRDEHIEDKVRAKQYLDGTNVLIKARDDLVITLLADALNDFHRLADSLDLIALAIDQERRPQSLHP